MSDKSDAKRSDIKIQIRVMSNSKQQLLDLATSISKLFDENDIEISEIKENKGYEGLKYRIYLTTRGEEEQWT